MRLTKLINFLYFYFMNSRRCLLSTVVIILAFATASLSAQITGFNKIKWERERIAPGLIWKSSHSILNDSVPQNINILIVNLQKRKIGIQYDPGANSPVSKQAPSAGAIAAVNGGFFNIRNGGSVTYIKAGGRIADSDTAKKWTANVNLNGAVLVRHNKEVIIDKAASNSWYDSHSEFEDILVTGPLLVRNKSFSELPGTSLVINRHPRTAFGLRHERKVVLLTLDGRTDQASGMTLKELAHLMILLRCRDAVNLDGGGSTTMWINGKPFNGVVNMPCDNKQFDHLGERSVSDIIIIK
jgi:exopolysaccharide biosynthesis protein